MGGGESWGTEAPRGGAGIEISRLESVMSLHPAVVNKFWTRN